MIEKEGETNLPKSEKGEFLAEDLEEETELAPQAMPRVFWWDFRSWDWIEDLESMLFFLLLPFPCEVEEREESKLMFAEYGEKWRKKEF